jgi:alternate signal-mediated exported protein
MNKAIKGSIAAGAAGILLLGGAGTFALWQDTKNIDAGSLSTGELNLTLGGAGAWNDLTSGTADPISDISTFNIVPGDTLVYTTTATINAEGDNLKGTLTVAEDTFTLPTGASAVITTQESAEGLDAVGNVLTFTEAGTYTVDVKLTVTFDANGLADQDEALDLDGIALTLQQNA